MEDEIIEILVAGGLFLAGTVAAQFFLHKYRDAILHRIRTMLPNYPEVRCVVIKALQLNGKAVACIVTIRDKSYVLTRMLGMRDDGGSVVMRGNDQVNVVSEKTEILTEAQMLAELACENLDGYSDAELAQMGLYPEKVARGMGIIDKEHNVCKAYKICDERQLEELKYSS